MNFSRTRAHPPPPLPTTQQHTPHTPPVYFSNSGLCLFENALPRLGLGRLGKKTARDTKDLCLIPLWQDRNACQNTCDTFPFLDPSDDVPHLPSLCIFCRRTAPLSVFRGCHRRTPLVRQHIDVLCSFQWDPVSGWGVGRPAEDTRWWLILNTQYFFSFSLLSFLPIPCAKTPNAYDQCSRPIPFFPFLGPCGKNIARRSGEGCSAFPVQTLPTRCPEISLVLSCQAICIKAYDHDGTVRPKMGGCLRCAIISRERSLDNR